MDRVAKSSTAPAFAPADRLRAQRSGLFIFRRSLYPLLVWSMWTGFQVLRSLGASYGNSQFIGKRVHFDFSAAAGITFGECILVAVPGTAYRFAVPRNGSRRTIPVVGCKRICATPTCGASVDSNFVYEKIPLETIAFEMSARFTAGESFVVHDELTGWFEPKSASSVKA